MALLTDTTPRFADRPGQPQPMQLRARLARAKAAYTTRRADLSRAVDLAAGERRPRAGDLVLARVSAVGQHTRIELRHGRRAHLHVGDEVVVCYGARYAPDQFESCVPDDLEPCHLVAAGGVASRMLSRHQRMKAPTAIEPIGLLVDAHGEVLNIERWAIAPRRVGPDRPPVVAVLGTSMNSGKTTTAQSLVRGFGQCGQQAAAAKVTGTGAGGDRWSVTDAGAYPVLDFTDAGVPSTFGVATRKLEEIMETIVATLAAEAPDVIVLEVADGLCQRETAALLETEAFRALVDGVIFAAGEALGAMAGVEVLRAKGVPALAVSGVVTSSPLASREAAALVDVPVVRTVEIAAGSWLPELRVARACAVAA